jgi:transcriptional regulator with XRE-family HTH domain
VAVQRRKPIPNDLLRAARERKGMDRAALAAAVNDYLDKLGFDSTIDYVHVGKWERGVVAFPKERNRAAVRAVLGVASDAQLGFVDPRGVNLDDVDRQTFLKTTFGMGLGAAVGWHRAWPGVDTEEILATVAGPTQYYRQMEAAAPNDLLAPAVDAHLALATGIVNRMANTPAAYGLLAETEGLAAWVALDRADNAGARRHYSQAVEYAARANHPLLGAYMLASLGHAAVETGMVKFGLSRLQEAHAELDSTAPNTAFAWLASLLATAHAANHDRDEALSWMRHAETYTTRDRGEPRWPWVFAWNDAKYARYQATTLARLGDIKAAQHAFAMAEPALTAPKRKALADVELGAILAHSGYVGEGCRLAIKAMSVARTFGSDNIVEKIHQFRAGLPDTVEVSDLDSVLGVQRGRTWA